MRTNIIKPSLIIVLLTCMLNYTVKAQFTGETYKERVNINKSLIIGDVHVAKQVEVDERGINIYKNSKNIDGHPVFRVHFTEANQFVNTVEGLNYLELLDLYNTKRSQHLLIKPHHKTELVPTPYYPSNLSELHIALDPGHFAGNFDEAIMEDRYVKIRGNELGVEKDVMIYEADLTYTTADMVLEKLISAGAKRENILITRPQGKSAMGKGFKDWLKSDFKRQLDSCKRIKLISEKDYALLSTTNNNEIIFNKFFKFMDFRTREHKINTFRPAMTIVIHYNAEEASERDALGYLKPVDTNYSVAFIPGAFKMGELNNSEHNIQMMRLMLSTDLENSSALANFILKQKESTMGIKPLPAENKYQYIKDFCIKTEHDGVYARNLALTRSIRGAVVYLEALYQDNRKEALLLSNRTFLWKGRMVSPRLNEESDAITNGIKEFLIFNQQKFARK